MTYPQLEEWKQNDYKYLKTTSLAMFEYYCLLNEIIEIKNNRAHTKNDNSNNFFEI